MRSTRSTLFKTCIAGMLLFAFSSVSLAQPAPRPKPQLDGLEMKVDNLIRDYAALDIFSGVVLIADNGRPIYQKAFGMADRSKKIKNTLNTKFDIGSMNKTFTDVVLLQLMDEGKLSIEDPVGKFLPAFSKGDFGKITIEMLMTHSSGLGQYYDRPGFFEAPASEKDIASLVKSIQTMPLMFEPGNGQEYSNSGYILLGATIEAITGKSYFDNVRERIVEPLGLKNTWLTRTGVPDRSIGYLKTMTGGIRDNISFNEPANPDGGFMSTALDVMTFYREYYNGTTLLSEEAKMRGPFFNMIQPHRTTGAAIPHAGGANGINAVNMEIMRDGITIVVLANMDEPVAEKISFGILAIIRGQEPDAPALPVMQEVYQAYTEHGIKYVKQHFERLTKNAHPADPKAVILNQMGYNMLFSGNLSAALEMFKLNTELFPDDPNVWDSHGEALRKKGDRDAALTSYRKALALDPQFPSAREAVAELEKEGE